MAELETKDEYTREFLDDLIPASQHPGAESESGCIHDATPHNDELFLKSKKVHCCPNGPDKNFSEIPSFATVSNHTAAKEADTKPADEAVDKDLEKSSSNDCSEQPNKELQPVAQNFSFSSKLYLILALMCSTNLSLAMVSSLIGPLFPHQALVKGGSGMLIGIVMSSYDAARFLVAPFIGRYVGVLGHRFLLICGPFVVSYSTLAFGLLGLAPAGHWFFALCVLSRMLSGLGGITYTVTSISMQPILFGPHFGFAFGLLRSFSSIGVIVGPAAGGVLYTAGGYALPFWVVGGVCMLLTLVQAIIVPDLTKLAGDAVIHNKLTSKVVLATDQHNEKTQHIDDNKPQRATMRKFLSSPSMLHAFFLNATFGFTVMFYYSSISLHILPVVGDVSRVGYVMLIAGAVEITVAPFAGWLLDRFIPAKVSVLMYYLLCTTGLTLAGPSPLLPILSKSLPLIITGIIFYGTGLATGYSTPYKLAHQHAKAQKYANDQHTHGLITGCLMTCTTFGGFLGSLAGASMQAAIGFAWASTIFSGFLLILASLTALSLFFSYCCKPVESP